MRRRRAPRRVAHLLLLACLAGRVVAAQELMPPPPPVTPGCPASAQPEWSTASASRKRELLRRCQPEPAAPQALVTAPPPAPPPARPPPLRDPGEGTSDPLSVDLRRSTAPSRLARIAALTAAGAGVSSAAGVFVGFSALRPSWRPYFVVPALVGAAATACLVHAVGTVMKGDGHLGGALLGATLGATAGLLAAVGYQELAGSESTPLTIGLGITASVLLTTVGAVLGWELTTPPPLSLYAAPVGDGLTAGIGGRW